MTSKKYTPPATIPPDDKSHIVGTGPYMVSDYSLDKQAVLVKNPNYFLPGIYSGYGISTIPVLSQITITNYSDATGLKNTLVSGQIDMAYRSLDSSAVKSLHP